MTSTCRREMRDLSVSREGREAESRIVWTMRSGEYVWRQQSSAETDQGPGMTSGGTSGELTLMTAPAVGSQMTWARSAPCEGTRMRVGGCKRSG